MRQSMTAKGTVEQTCSPHGSQQAERKEGPGDKICLLKGILLVAYF
jgi:hypothetical protein